MMMFNAMGSEAPAPKTEEITETGNHGTKDNCGYCCDTRTEQGIEKMDLTWKDGMKTEEEIKTFDPIANPINNVMSNKQGVGSAGYDYSNWDQASK
jgi:hypothetical protein